MLYKTKNPHGGDIYSRPVALDFSANTNPYGTPRAVLDAVSGCLGNLHRYPDPCCRTLVRAIAEHEAVPESYILCGNGAAELIYACCNALHLKKAAELAPTFAEYSLALERTGCSVCRYMLREDLDFALDEGILNFLEQQRPEALFLCNPNNPSGKTADFNLLIKILAFSRQTGMFLFVDECFLDLTDSGRSLREFLPDHPRLFILRAFTKSYGMAGLRLGWCMSADETLLHRMARETQPWNVSTPAQAAGTAALGEHEFLEKTRALIRTQRPVLAAGLRGLGFRVIDSEANFILFHGPENLHRDLAELGISIRSCDNYHGLGPGWYRIAVRLPEENQALLTALGRITERNANG